MTPGNIPGHSQDVSEQQWIHNNQLAHHHGKRQAATLLTPGNIPGSQAAGELVLGSQAANGLLPGSQAAAQLWTDQLRNKEQL